MPVPSMSMLRSVARRASFTVAIGAVFLGSSLLAATPALAQDTCDLACQGAIVNNDVPIGDVLSPDPIVDVVESPDFGVAAVIDSDGDGLTDADEANIYGTNPYEADTDFDFITDNVEIAVYGTNPTYSDSDADGLSDNDEFVHGSAPLVADTDGDRLLDGNEVYVYGTRPNNVDSDGDRTWDGHELDVCTDSLDPNSNPSRSTTCYGGPVHS